MRRDHVVTKVGIAVDVDVAVNAMVYAELRVAATFVVVLRLGLDLVLVVQQLRVRVGVGVRGGHRRRQLGRRLHRALVAPDLVDRVRAPVRPLLEIVHVDVVRPTNRVGILPVQHLFGVLAVGHGGGRQERDQEREQQHQPRHRVCNLLLGGANYLRVQRRGGRRAVVDINR